MSRLARMAAAAAFVVAAGAACAEAVVGLHTWSAHAGGHDLSNDNPGAFVREGALQLGAYRNSIRRTSVYAAGVVELWGPVGAFAGVASGYRTSAPGGLQVIGGLTIAGPRVLGVLPRLSLVPPAGTVGSGVIHLTLETSL